MKAQDILVGKSIKIFSEKNQLVLENDILKLSLSKANGDAKPLEDFKPQTAPYSCYEIVARKVKLKNIWYILMKLIS